MTHEPYCQERSLWTQAPIACGLVRRFGDTIAMQHVSRSSGFGAYFRSLFPLLHLGVVTKRKCDN